MKAGLLTFPHESVSDVAELAVVAEDCGYNDFWLADDRFHRDVYVTLAHCAERTQRIRLGTCVTDPYSRHPAITAMSIATLDEVSRGRAVLGIGAGVSGFAQLGIVRNRPARAIREAVELIRELFSGEEVDYHGELVSFERGKLGFEPVRADLPIYIASNGPFGQRVAGALGDGAIMEGCATPEEVRAFSAEVRSGATRAGRDSFKVELVARLDASVAGNGQSTRDALRPYVARILGAGRQRFATLDAQGINLPEDAKASVADVGYVSGFEPYLHLLPLIPDRYVDALSLGGTTEEVIDRVVALGRAGIDQIIIHPIDAPTAPAKETIRLFATEVVPAARRKLAHAASTVATKGYPPQLAVTGLHPAPRATLKKRSETLEKRK